MKVSPKGRDLIAYGRRSPRSILSTSRLDTPNRVAMEGDL